MRPLGQHELYAWAFSQGVKSVTGKKDDVPESVSIITDDNTVAITSVAEWRAGATITHDCERLNKCSKV